MAFRFTTLTWEKIQTILSWFDADTGDATFINDVSVGGDVKAKSFSTGSISSLADDTASSVILSNTEYGSATCFFIDITIRNTAGGLSHRMARIACFGHTAGADYSYILSDVGDAGTGIEVLDTDVTGTTGTDGKLVYALYNDGSTWKVKIENRTGSAKRIIYNITCME